jgi:translation elongation factor EF-G
MLFISGKKHRFGRVDEGQATLDWMPQERERGITITAAATTIPWKGYNINLIDTPGHVDFTAEVERALRVVDGMIALFCGVGGVEPQSETVWRQAERYKVPRIAFINKMDRVGADFFKVVEEMREKLGTNPAPIAIPMGKEEEFAGVIDLLSMEAILFPREENGNWVEPRRTAIPPELRPQAEREQEKLFETVALADPKFLELFLAEEVSPQEVRAALRRATIAGKLVPVARAQQYGSKGWISSWIWFWISFPLPLICRQFVELGRAKRWSAGLLLMSPFPLSSSKSKPTGTLGRCTSCGFTRGSCAAAKAYLTLVKGTCSGLAVFSQSTLTSAFLWRNCGPER